MPKFNDDVPRYAFTALAAAEPPPEAFHTWEEWQDLIAETARVQSKNPHEDLVTRRLSTVAIWARRNGR